MENQKFQTSKNTESSILLSRVTEKVEILEGASQVSSVGLAAQLQLRGSYLKVKAGNMGQSQDSVFCPVPSQSC